MVIVGYHASHEQIPPDRLLEDLRHAERSGFQAAMCSDHFNPWSRRQGHSGFAWSWLGAALATTTMRIGTVTAPGQRYHPAVLAQATATLECMFPGRFWVALGSGEYLNESITGGPWPRKEVRQRRLEESVDVMRRMFDGEEVSHDGLVTVTAARLWDRPERRPPFFVPALTSPTAGRGAAWADGLITINQPHETLAEILDAYRSAGGAGPAVLQVHLCWAPTEDEAMTVARKQWADNVYAPPVASDLPTVDHFEVLGRHTTDEALRRSVLVSAYLDRLAGWLRELADLGFDELYLHHVGAEQGAFIDAFADHVLPKLWT